MQKPSFTARRALAGVLAGAALVAAGCGDDESDGGLDPASLMPASAPVYFEVTVRPEGDLREDFEAVASKILRSDDVGERVKALVNTVVADEDTTFEDDIEPWLGDKIGGGIVSLTDPQSPDFAIAVATTDSDAAFESLEEEGTTEVEYEGTKYLRDGDDDTVAGIVGDALVVGTEPGFKAVVDAEESGETLADSDRLEQAREGVDVDAALGFLYADLESAITALAAGQPLIASQIEPLKEALGDAATIGAAFTVADDAIRVEAAQIGGPKAEPKGDPAAVLAGLPESTVIGAGLGAVGPTLQQVVDQILGAGPILGQDPRQLLQQLEQQVGISIQEDLLSWMGEGAISIQGGSISEIGGGLVVRSTDPAKTAEAIEKLVPVVRGFGATVRTEAPQGAEEGFRVDLSDSGLSGLELLVGLQGDRFVVGVNPQVVAALLAGEQEGSLGESAKFKAAAAKLGDGIQPSFYADFEAIVSFLALAAGSDPDFQAAKPYLDAFSAIVAGSKRDGDTNRARLAITLK